MSDELTSQRLKDAEGFILAEVDGQTFAVPARHVVEYVPSGPVRSVPALRAQVLGLALYRERAIPLVDVGFGSGGANEESNADRKWLVVKYWDGDECALSVTRVRELVQARPKTQSSDDGATNEIITVANDEIPVLDVDTLFSNARAAEHAVSAS